MTATGAGNLLAGVLGSGLQPLAARRTIELDHGAVSRWGAALLSYGRATISPPLGVRKAPKLLVVYGNIRTVPSPIPISPPWGKGPPQLPIPGAFSESCCRLTP